MSFVYKNPIVLSTVTAPDSPTSLDRNYGTNFSVYNIGGHMEVYSLSDLVFTIPSGSTGQIFYSGNSIPARLYVSPNVLTSKLYLYSDQISTGRRRIGQTVYVHETQTTYQFVIPNFETLISAATEAGVVVWDGSEFYEVRNKIGATPNAAGQELIDAFTGSTIEGYNGATREESNWRIFWGTDWQLTGGTYNSETGTLNLDNNTGGTLSVTGFTSGGGTNTYVTGGTITYDSNGNLVLLNNDDTSVDITGLKAITGATLVGSTLTLTDNLGGDVSVSGFTTQQSDIYVTGGTYTNATGTLELRRNDDNTIDITGFLTGSTGTQNLQQVLDTGNVSTTGMYISGATLSATTVDINGGTIDNVAIGSTNPVSLVSNSVDINGGTIDNVAIGSTNPVSLVSNSVDINGGTIDNVAIGSTNPVSLVSNSVDINGGTIDNVTLGFNNPVILVSNSVDINGGTIDNTTIGAQVRSTGAFTYIYDNNGLTGNTGQILSTSTTGITWTDSSSTDYYVTGGTLSAQGELTLTRNDGNSIEITGFTAQESDTYVTGATYTESTGILTLTRNDGNTFGAGGWDYVKSVTASNNNITVTQNDGDASLIGIEAITGLGYNNWGVTGSTTGGLFYNGTELPFITGGTFSSGTLTLGINNGLESNIQVTGFDADDTYITGGTYNPTTLTLGNSDGVNITISGFAPEITGGTYNSGTLSLLDNTGGSVDITGITFTSTNIYNTDGQLDGNRVIDQNGNSLAFSGGTVSVGTGTTTPVCAILELASTNQGLLIPRMTQVQRLAINSPIPGLLVFCTDSDSNGQEGMYMYKSLGWVNVL